MNDNNFGKIALIVWGVASFVYIAFTAWNDFRNNQLVRAYQTGRAEAINEVAKQAMDKACDGFEMEDGKGDKIELVQKMCLNIRPMENGKPK